MLFDTHTERETFSRVAFTVVVTNGPDHAGNRNRLGKLLPHCQRKISCTQTTEKMSIVRYQRIHFSAESKVMQFCGREVQNEATRKCKFEWQIGWVLQDRDSELDSWARFHGLIVNGTWEWNMKEQMRDCICREQSQATLHNVLLIADIMKSHLPRPQKFLRVHGARKY